jgi:hypothetical protein
MEYTWSEDTLRIVARVFKTFVKAYELRAGSPRDFENHGSNEDFIIVDQHLGNEALHDMIVRWATELSSSGLPIVATSIGRIEALQLLGAGWDTRVFKARTTDNMEVVIKYGLSRNHLQRESQVL